MIRTPYIDNYNRPFDDLACWFRPRNLIGISKPADPSPHAVHIANIPLWSNVETAIGLIAGSLPALRQFFAHHRSPGATTRGTEGSRGLHPGSAALVTIGGSGGSKLRERKGLKSNFEVDEAEQGDWTRLEDNGSDKESTVPIRDTQRDMTFEVEMTSSPEHTHGRGDR